MRNAGDELANRRKFFSAAEVVSDFLFFRQVSDADDEADDVVGGIADVGESNRCGKLSSVLSSVHVLAGPQRLVELNGRNRLTRASR